MPENGLSLVSPGAFYASRLILALFRHLLVDPKARKVIIIEHPLLPLHVKDVIARVLFENLQVKLSFITLLALLLNIDQVPSISFASSHLLSLFSSGRITGMVLDCGHLESVVLPVRGLL